MICIIKHNETMGTLLISGFRLQGVFRRACQRKNKKSGVSAAKIEFGVYRQTETDAYRRRFFLYMRELSAIIYVYSKRLFTKN